MAITVNATGTEGTQGSSASYNYTNITVAAGSNTALVFQITFTANVTGITCTWDSGGTNQSMTVLNSQKEDTWSNYVYVFGLLAPTTGNKTLAVSWTTNSSITACAAAFDGVLQTSIAAAFTNAANNSANSANPSLSITTASGDATFAGIVCSNSISGVTTTQLYRNGSAHQAASYALSSGSSDAHTWTMSSSNWGMAGIRLNQVSAGGRTTKNTRSAPLGVEIGMNWRGGL